MSNTPLSEHAISRSPRPLIVKVGSTLPALSQERGDFEDWIRRGMGLAPQDVIVVDPTKGESLPSVEVTCGIVVTGSHAMITDHEVWSEQTAVWLGRATERGIPVLGICYGHQLLAYALGGTVEDNPNGNEFGTVTACFTSRADPDPILGGLGRNVKVQTSHTQSVTCLPPGAQILAYSEMDPHLAFVVGDRAWGLQFHPEFDADVVRTYVEATRNALTAQGRDPEAIRDAVEETPVGNTILRRFAQLLLTPESAASDAIVAGDRV
jgi:GMP synthase (glutamine-hydrolysing)